MTLPLVPGLPLTLIGSAAAVATFAVRHAARRQQGAPTRSGVRAGRIWIIVNPTKPADYPAFRKQVDEACLRLTGKTPHWLETSPEDPGTGQGLKALRAKPSLVLVAGGDGTVRAVAAALAHSGVHMGILPVGTGNLAARNLRLPLELGEAIEVALSGRTMTIDLAWLRMEEVDTPAEIPAEGHLLHEGQARRVRPLPPGRNEPREDEFAYLVIAGLGFDGETMAGTSSKLKKTVGWSAYVISALRALRSERMRATLRLYAPGVEREHAPWTRALPEKLLETIDSTNTISEENPMLEVVRSKQDVVESEVRARTILFANCGELPFVILAPDAKLDDGALDVIAIDTKGGLVGWSSLAIKIFAQGIGMRPLNTAMDPGQIAFQQVRNAQVDVDQPYPVQVDGDAVGTARRVFARIDAGALLLRGSRQT